MKLSNIIPDITVRWRFLPLDDFGWGCKRCLYAYVAPDRKEILYIGKSWGVTVRGRWQRDAKNDFWDDLENDRYIREHCVLMGKVDLNYNGRLTHKLLADVESLLIMGEQPWGNIQSKKSRRARPGLIVQCSGSWRGQAQYYKDNS